MPTRKTLHWREVEIIRRLKTVLKLPVTKIALAVGRNKSQIYKALDKKWAPGKRGHPKALSKRDVDKLVRVVKEAVRRSRCRYEVTLAMVKKKAGCRACSRTLRTELAKRRIKFRRLRSKPLLTKADKAARRAFALAYKGKTEAWWLRHINLHHDVKNFPVYMNKAGRGIAAQREVRGVYREPGQGLDEAYVVAPKGTRYHTCVKSVRVGGGVNATGVCLWEELKGRWNGAAAANLYEGPIHRSLARTCPAKRKFRVLEDNDPTGWKSSKGVAAKKRARIEVFAIPKRSPDLNVMDYAIWKAVSRRMRKQERRFPANKVESKAAFVERLKRTAKALPATLVRRSIVDMRRRCQRLHAAKGGHIEEGGR